VSLAVLRRFFEVDAHRSPLLLVFEDIHCAGPDGIRTLRSLIGQMRGAPIVVLCTARPELMSRPTISPRPRATGTSASTSRRCRRARARCSPDAPGPIENCPEELVTTA